MAQVKTKLGIDEWVEKYFDNEYSTWTFSDDGMHPQDKSTWFLEDLIEEHERYVLNETTSHIGLKEYEE
jgi:hypothetical protein